MGITERIANLSIPSVLAIVAVLLAIRFLLIKHKHPFAKSVAEIAESLGVAMALVFLLIRPFIVQAFFIPSPSMVPTLLERDHILVNKFIYRFKEPQYKDIVVFKAPVEAVPVDEGKMNLKEQILSEADARGLEGEERDKFVRKMSKRYEKDFIKRVIAVPGDTVRITRGYVLADGEEYNHKDLRLYLAEFAEGDDRVMVKLQKDRVVVNGNPVSKEELAESLDVEIDKIEIVPGKVYLNGKALKEPYTAEDPDIDYPLENTNPKWVTTDKDGNKVVKIPDGKLLVVGDNRNNSYDARFWGLLDRERVLGKAMFMFWPLNRVGLVR